MKKKPANHCSIKESRNEWPKGDNFGWHKNEIRSAGTVQQEQRAGSASPSLHWDEEGERERTADIHHPGHALTVQILY